MKIKSWVFVLVNRPILSVCGGASPFFKEILQGRCYDRPPTGDVRDCPEIVDGFVAILENQLDSDITTTTFGTHLESIDLSVTEGQTLLFLPFQHSAQGDEEYVSPLRHISHLHSWSSWKSWMSWEPSSFSEHSLWTTPESTPGGAFLTGLTFCGMGEGKNCSVEGSNAYWKYWEVIYGHFVANAEGDIQIVLPPRVNVDFIERSIVGNLNPGKISKVAVYAEDCTGHNAEFLMASIHAAGKDADDITCSDDPIEFALCVPDRNSETCVSYMDSCIHHPEAANDVPPTVNPTEQEDWERFSDNTQIIHTKKDHKPYITVFWFLCLFLLASCFLCVGRGPLCTTRCLIPTIQATTRSHVVSDTIRSYKKVLPF